MHFKSLTPCGWFFLRGSSVFKVRECVCVLNVGVCVHILSGSVKPLFPALSLCDMSARSKTALSWTVLEFTMVTR